MFQPLLIVEQLLMDLKVLLYCWCTFGHFWIFWGIFGHFCARLYTLIQIEWADKVIKELMEDDNIDQIYTDDTPILEPRPSILTDENRDPLTELLMFYAEKALDFPILVGSLGSVCESPLPSSPPWLSPSLPSSLLPPSLSLFPASLHLSLPPSSLPFSPPCLPPSLPSSLRLSLPPFSLPPSSSLSSSLPSPSSLPLLPVS